jgi:transposase
MLFVGDDWAEDHHDIEIVDEAGKVLTRRRLPEGLEGVTRLHSLVAKQMPDDWVDLDVSEAAALVKVGIETDRGSWVAALIAAGYEVFAINPMSVARYREPHSTSGAKSDAADAHLLAEIVRRDRAHHRPAAGDTDEGEAIKLTARTHQSLIWDRTRHVLRLGSTLREYFPAALLAFETRTHPMPSSCWLGHQTQTRRPAEPRGDHLRPQTRSPTPRRGPSPAAAEHPAGPRTAAATGVAERLCRGRGQRGRHHQRAERPDRPTRGGGGRAFWPAPGR